MNREMIQARKALLAGRETEKNLPYYLRALAGSYYRMAFYNLTMRYTTFAEAVKEGLQQTDERTEAYAAQLKKQLAALLAEQAAPEELKEAIDALFVMRGEITVLMQALTAYTDKLYLHEYALKRLAPAMEDTTEDIDNYAALEELESYLFRDEEQKISYDCLSFLVSELPVRMTKGKFMEWVRSMASAAYKDADAEGLHRAFYMLYSTAGLYEPEGMEQFPEYAEVLQYFSFVDYRNMTEEQYRDAKERLEKVTKRISSDVEVYFSLIEIVNSLLMLFFTVSYAMPQEVEQTEGCRQVLRLLLRKEPYTEEEIAEAFASFEGEPEELDEFLAEEKAYLDELPVKEEMISALMQKELYTRVRYAGLLHTDSVFVELEKNERQQEGFKESLEAFCTRLSEVLENGQRAVNRARMAQVMQMLPMPFTKKSEVQKYILAALENCHDMSEKTAALREIRKLAEEMW